ncbi:MAG: TldD/PmbA family protein [Actinomycetes bacterium]
MIDEELLHRTLTTGLRNGADFAEVFAEERSGTAASLDDGRIEELSSSRRRGVGIRVVAGDTTGFAHTADLSPAGLQEAAEAAAAAARGGGGGTRTIALERRPAVPTHAVRDLPDAVDKARKVDALRRADAAAREERAEGGAVQQVSAGYADAVRRILVANSDGLLTGDEQVRTRFSVSVVVNGDSGLQTGSEAPGRTVGWELFDQFPPEEIARVAARRALSKVHARPAPSGRFPVILRRGAGGVLFHEACGHGLEADLVARDASIFRGRVGEAVASPLVTVVDDGRMAREWGALAIDDEGTPTQRNVLIEDGVLTDFMWDRLRAGKEGRSSSGNGRRERYDVLPMVRMTNTFLERGAEDPEAIIAGTEYGVYCVALGGGQVDPATGEFVFGMTEAYLVEGGRITAPLRGAQLIGNGPEAMRAVDAVGNDFETWTGMCGKSGQSVPVSSGQPTLRVAELTIGGTAA